MANLIPTQAKKKIKLEYWIRVFSVWLILLSVVALVVSVLNIPAYILIQNQLQGYGTQYADASAENTSFEQVESEIVLANNTAVLLSTTENVPAIVPYAELVASITPETVTVSSYRLTRSGTDVNQVVISGVAEDRESLVAFSNELESVSDFASAEIPLSNLAKDRNIPFTINVVLNPES